MWWGRCFGEGVRVLHGMGRDKRMVGRESGDKREWMGREWVGPIGGGVKEGMGVNYLFSIWATLVTL